MTKNRDHWPDNCISLVRGRLLLRHEWAYGRGCIPHVTVDPSRVGIGTRAARHFVESLGHEVSVCVQRDISPAKRQAL